MKITENSKNKISKAISKIAWLNKETIENYNDIYNIVYCIEVLKECVADKSIMQEVEELLIEAYNEQAIEK